MPMKFKTVADRRAYWRRRYWKNREAVLAKRRADYAATDPETRSAKNREHYLKHRDALLAQQAKKRAANREERRAADRRAYRIRHYGTPTPEPGQLSLDGTKRFRNFGGKHTAPPKPAKTVFYGKKMKFPALPPTRRIAKPKPVPPPPPPRPVVQLPKRDPWIPQPISRWEPGLDRVAS